MLIKHATVGDTLSQAEFEGGTLHVDESDNPIDLSDIPLPHGSFSNSTTLTISGLTTAAYPITFDTDEVKYLMTHSTGVNPSRIYVDVEGCYLITFSAVCKSSAPNKKLDIWFAVDGVNVPRSNTISNFVGSGNERIVTVTFLYEFLANQYFELYYASNDAGTTIVATAAQTNPTRPACPSIILTVNKISNK